MEKKKAALEIRRQIVERDELRRQSMLKEQQEKTLGIEERSQNSQQTDKMVNILQESKIGTQGKLLTNIQASIREEVAILPNQTQQEKDSWLIDLRPNGAKGQQKLSQPEQTAVKERATKEQSQLRESGADIREQMSPEIEIHKIRLKESLFLEEMETPRKTPTMLKSTNNERLGEKTTITQKETSNKKTDLMTIMSAITIALAPYCKLYEAIKEGIQDNTSILASMSAKITHIENFMTATESKTMDHQKDWEKEVEALKKQIRSLNTIRNQEEEKIRKSPLDRQMEDSVRRKEESHLDKEEKDSCTSGQLPYPIKSGLCTKAKKKPPVLLKLINKEKAQKQAMAEKGNQQNSNKQKEKSRKDSQRDTQEWATEENKMSSPRSTEDFMCDTNMMNLSQHWETASENSVIEVSQDNQELEQESVQDKPMLEIMKKQKNIGRQQKPEMVIQEEKKEDIDNYSRDYKQKRQPSIHRKENQKSNDNNEKTRSNKSEKQVRIFKVTQADPNRGHMILNRRTLLKIMSTMQSLKKIRTEDIMLVEPYHRGKTAKAYIHLKEECVQNMDKTVGREMEKNGLELTEITSDNQTRKLDPYGNQQGERKNRDISRTDECYRGNRIGKNQEVDGYNRERDYVHDKHRKEYHKRTSVENNKRHGQRRNEQQGTETSNLRHRFRRDSRCDKQQPSPRHRCSSGGKEKWGKPVPAKIKTKAPRTGPVAWIKTVLNLNSEN
ncbi:trichohyalin-like [Ambystoma mexicanum]|uniref:trichohyalin-like n=1 Tax=Ambystoma mexicanum TaxID=8296 RepID=UPI0037E76CFA